ncbi:uncharacterized protein Pyn_02885 [Prunus yedoensis var. nudiflora]|uniref:Uncharacterized protein n=1 Tax=Prunus yedoensis var. nudiflora TaxID=2094558 RepID=A0A314U7A3_PRUYE|nr:uncharacterized protein Pyn_02885 [Prunus yedoensis var. nudiflora]
MAGYSTHCENMLDYAEDCLATYEEIVNGIHDAPKIAHKYIHDWQKSTLELYQGSIYMVGWDADGLPHVYKVDSSGPVKKTKSKHCYGFANGTGGKQVREYFKSFNVEVQSSNKLLETVTRALLYAAPFDDRSGGYLLVFKVKQRGFDDLYHKSVLEALFDHYDALAGHLSNSFFFLFPKRDYKPTHDINVKVHKGFKRKFRKEYKDNVVIKQGRRFVIRLVHFHSIPDELYEQIRKQNRQHNVPREVQALPWVLIEQFGQVPILFCKPTQEVMRDLQDV